MKLRPYQEEAAAFFEIAGGGIYADGPGTGKTFGSLEIARRWGSRCTLIVVPVLQGAGIKNWEHAVAVASTEDCYVANGPPLERERLYADWEATGGICIVGYETMMRDAAALGDYRNGTVIADEAHRLVNRNAKTTKAFAKLSRKADHVLLVTATPMVNEADDLWSLFHILDPKLYSSYWNWVHQHCTSKVTDFGGKLERPVELVTGMLPGADLQIKAQLERWLVYRPIGDLLPHLGEPTVQVLSVTMSKVEKRLYKELKKQYVTMHEGEEVVALNEVSKITRLRQLSSDWSSIFGEVGAGSKAKAAAELVKDLGEQVVVMCAYQAACDRIVELVGDDAVAYHGGVERTPEVLADFKAGKRRVLVGTLGSLGESIDGLQCARVLVLVDRPWNPKGYDQAVGRLRRSGQERPVLVYHVTAEGTMDERVAEALTEKRSVAQALGVG